LALILILSSHTFCHAQQQPSRDSQYKARPSNKASPAINQIPRLELLLALNQVDLALKQLEAAQECANAATNLANVAEIHANEIELTAVARVANELKKQLEDLITNIKDSTSSVINTRLKAATEAPLSLL
jgi:DNA-binding transcriptional MerR regulator